MTQPAQGQGAPTIPKSEKISPISEPETTATVEGDENIDSDDTDVQVRTCAMAGTTTTWEVARFPGPSLTYTYCSGNVMYRLDLRRQRNSSKREMIYFVVASGTKRCKVIRTGWLDFRGEETRRHHHHHQHRLHRHDLPLPTTTKEIHIWLKLKGRFLVPPQVPKVTANPPILSKSILHWSTNVQKRGAFSRQISRHAT